MIPCSHQVVEDIHAYILALEVSVPAALIPQFRGIACNIMKWCIEEYTRGRSSTLVPYNDILVSLSIVFGLSPELCTRHP